MTFTSTTSPRHRLSISQRSCQTAQPALPRYHPPFYFTRPLFGERKVTNFFALSSSPHPFPARSHKVTKLWALTSPYSQRPFSPSRRVQSYETFRFVKPLSLSSTHLLTGRQRHKVFDIHKCRPIPSLPYPFIKDHAKPHTQTVRSPHPPRLLPLLFFKGCKITNLLSCQAPLTFPSAGCGKVTDFWAFASAPLPPYPLSKTPMLLRGGNAKVRNFQLCQAPSSDSLSSKINQGLSGSAKLRSFSLCQAPPFPPPFSLGSAKVLITFYCPTRRLSKTLLILGRGQRYGILGFVKPPSDASFQRPVVPLVSAKVRLFPHRQAPFRRTGMLMLKNPVCLRRKQRYEAGLCLFWRSPIYGLRH